MFDGTNGPTELANTFGDSACHSEDLVASIVEQKVVVVKRGSALVPMETLGPEVKSKYFRKRVFKPPVMSPTGLGRCCSTVSGALAERFPSWST
jgi:hypothetical protein